MKQDASPDRLRLRHLNCFLAIAQEQHLGRAAERLRLTQPAVSKTLLELEQILGVRLLERGRFGARLTREGEVFLGHALSVRDALNAARRSVGAGAGPAAETLALGVLPTLAPDLLPPALAALREAHSGARVVVHTAANRPLLEMLRAGAVDCVIGRMPEPDDALGLSFELLFVEPLVLAVRPAHPLSGRAAVAPRQVLEYPLVVATPGTVPRHHTESFLQAHGLRLPQHRTETISVSLGRVLALQSDAVWFVAAGAVAADLAAGILERLPIATEGTEEPVGLLYRAEGGASSLARALMKAVRRAARARAPRPD